MGTMAPVLQVVGGIIGAFGSIGSGFAKAKAARFNAELDKNNARIARDNANITMQAGNEQAFITGLKGKAQAGEIKVNQAGGGIEVNSGSAVDTQISQKELNLLDAQTVRSNATKEAYGYVTQASGYENQANLEQQEARNDITAGYFNAASTLLGAGAQASSEWSDLKQQGAINGSTPTTGSSSTNDLGVGWSVLG